MDSGGCYRKSTDIQYFESIYGLNYRNLRILVTVVHGHTDEGNLVLPLSDYRNLDKTLEREEKIVICKIVPRVDLELSFLNVCFTLTWQN